MSALGWVAVGVVATLVALGTYFGRILGRCIRAFADSEEPDVGDPIGDAFPFARPKEV